MLTHLLCVSQTSEAANGNAESSNGLLRVLITLLLFQHQLICCQILLGAGICLRSFSLLTGAAKLLFFFVL